MITKAYLLINTPLLHREERSYITRAKRIAQIIRGIPGVVACHVITGGYQIIVETDLMDLSEIGKIITSEISTIPGVERCTVCIVLDENSPIREKELIGSREAIT